MHLCNVRLGSKKHTSTDTTGESFSVLSWSLDHLSLMYTTVPPRWCTMMASQKCMIDWNNVGLGAGLASYTVAQHQTNTESGSLVFCVGSCPHRHSLITVGVLSLSGMLACKDHKPSYDWWSYNETLAKRWIGAGAPSTNVEPELRQCCQKISCCKDNDQCIIWQIAGHRLWCLLLCQKTWQNSQTPTKILRRRFSDVSRQCQRGQN